MKIKNKINKIYIKSMNISEQREEIIKLPFEIK